jgi:hypothetical protein
VKVDSALDQSARPDALIHQTPSLRASVQLDDDYGDVGATIDPEAPEEPNGEGELESEDEVREALSRPPPVNSDILPLPWKGRLGYVCPTQFCCLCYTSNMANQMSTI